MERHKPPTFHWLFHTRFSDLFCRTVVIGAMLKAGFGKKSAHTRFCKQTNELYHIPMANLLCYHITFYPLLH